MIETKVNIEVKVQLINYTVLVGQAHHRSVQGPDRGGRCFLGFGYFFFFSFAHVTCTDIKFEVVMLVYRNQSDILDYTYAWLYVLDDDDKTDLEKVFTLYNEVY